MLSASLRSLIYHTSKVSTYCMQQNARTCSSSRTPISAALFKTNTDYSQGGRNLNRRRKSTTASSLLISEASTDGDAVRVQWGDGGDSRFHHIWLRDHCRCPECFNHSTNQRELNIVDVPLDIQPINVSANDQKELSIKWPDGHVTAFDAAWLKQCSYEENQNIFREKKHKSEDLFLWDKKGIDTIKPDPFNFAKILADDNEFFKLSQAIVKYGFAFVHETPTTVRAVEEVATKLGGFVKETHYGLVWDFSNESFDHADTAYTAGYLRGHTDSTYFSHPAGIQMLHCVGHEGTGGMNLLVDGFHAAERLRSEDKESFECLTSTIVPFHYKGDNLHLKAHGPIIELDPYEGCYSQIRFNTYDTAPLDGMKYEDVPGFYKALKAYTSITCDPASQHWFKLVPGELLVMGNWRVLHGRSSFTGTRKMHGCYVSGDDFFGRYRENKAKNLK